MQRSQTISELKNYFKIQELVCEHTFNAFGDKSWQFFDTMFLETLLVIRRDIFKVSMTINNWHYTGKYSMISPFTQRGFRCNICKIVKDKTIANQIYLTSHSNGAACDFDVKGLTAEQARQKIIENQNLLPHKIRLEKDVSWVHLDVYDNGTDDKVYLFRV